MLHILGLKIQILGNDVRLFKSTFKCKKRTSPPCHTKLSITRLAPVSTNRVIRLPQLRWDCDRRHRYSSGLALRLYHIHTVLWLRATGQTAKHRPPKSRVIPNATSRRSAPGICMHRCTVGGFHRRVYGQQPFVLRRVYSPAENQNHALNELRRTVRGTWLESRTSQDAPGLTSSSSYSTHGFTPIKKTHTYTHLTPCVHGRAASRYQIAHVRWFSIVSFVLTLEDPPDSPTVKAATVGCGVLWGSASAKSGIGSVCAYSPPVASWQ
jgi:hypothetical protein